MSRMFSDLYDAEYQELLEEYDDPYRAWAELTYRWNPFDIYDFETTFPEERWKTIDGFSRYEISDYGRVRSNVKNEPKILTPWFSSYGYPYVSLTDDNGNKIKRTIHSLVAEYFRYRVSDRMNVVRHMNSDPKDNRWWNLEWGTPAMNHRDMVDQGREFTKPIYCYETNKVYRSGVEFSRLTGVQKSSITQACKGLVGHAGGYHLCYEDEIDEHLANLEEWLDDSKSFGWKRVEAYNPETGEHYIFNSHREAEQALGVSDSGISNVLAGRITQTKGWMFRNVDGR